MESVTTWIDVVLEIVKVLGPLATLALTAYLANRVKSVATKDDVAEVGVAMDGKNDKLLAKVEALNAEVLRLQQGGSATPGTPDRRAETPTQVSVSHEGDVTLSKPKLKEAPE